MAKKKNDSSARNKSDGVMVVSIGMVPKKDMKKMKNGKCEMAKGGSCSGKEHKYAAGGMVTDNLKSVPSGNKGLKKLPKNVRNKMGFMAKGGYASK